jgi:hypothetical protein
MKRALAASFKYRRMIICEFHADSPKDQSNEVSIQKVVSDFKNINT